MAFEYTALAFRFGPKGNSLRPVFAALCDMAATDGTCFPSLPTLAERADVSVATVKRALKALEADTWVARARRSLADGSTTSTLYRVNYPRLLKAAEAAAAAQSALTAADFEPFEEEKTQQNMGAHCEPGGGSPRTGGRLTTNRGEAQAEPLNLSLNQSENLKGAHGALSLVVSDLSDCGLKRLASGQSWQAVEPTAAAVAAARDELRKRDAMRRASSGRPESGKKTAGGWPGHPA